MLWIEGIIHYLQFWIARLPLLSGPMRLLAAYLQNLI